MATIKQLFENYMNKDVRDIIDRNKLNDDVLKVYNLTPSDDRPQRLFDALVPAIKEDVDKGHAQDVLRVWIKTDNDAARKAADKASVMTTDKGKEIGKEESSEEEEEESDKIVQGSLIKETIKTGVQYKQNSFSWNTADMNGECFITHGEGEALVTDGTTRVVFIQGTPRAKQGAEIRKVPFSITELQEFVAANAGAIRAAVPTISDRDALTVGYLRALCAENGLISPDFDTAAHHVTYNDATEISTVDFHNFADLSPNLNILNDAFRDGIRTMFCDLLCCVAFMFRVRGHHFLPDMEGRYLKLFERCLYDQAALPAPWIAISRYAFHAVMPDTLDAFWTFCKDNSYIAGTLSKRYDSAPAGSAGVLALIKGVKDIMLILPQALKIADKEIKVLYDLGDKIHANRWAASVNARFYGVPRLRVNEDDIGVLASVVLGIYERLAERSELRNAPSLKRLASLAPATGGAIGRIASNTVSDERMRIDTGRSEDVVKAPG